MSIPIIVKLLVSLAVIIISNRFLKNLTLSLLAGTLTFAFWIGLGVPVILSTAFARITSLTNITLIILLCLVILLSIQMRKTGLVQELVSSVRSTFSPKAAMMILPAFIGLLPMPGGALFSAPLLDNFDDIPEMDPTAKTRINYWFRHVWEYAWPLYPGILLTADISGIDLWMFFAAGIPITILSITVGILFFIKKIPGESAELRAQRQKTRHFSIRPFLPIIIVVALYVLILTIFPDLVSMNQYLPLVISLSISILTVQFMHPLPGAVWKEMLLSPQIYKTAILVMMIRIYGAFIETSIDGMSVVQLMTQEMQSFGIPQLPLIILLPFIAGLTMGVSVGFAGAAMPVVVAMLGVDPVFGSLLGTVIFAYISGFMGTMLSPLHVCLIVTCDYYKTGFADSIRSFVLPASVMMVLGYGYTLLVSIVL